MNYENFDTVKSIHGEIEKLKQIFFELSQDNLSVGAENQNGPFFIIFLNDAKPDPDLKNVGTSFIEDCKRILAKKIEDLKNQLKEL